MLQRARQYLIHEIDAAQVVKYMRDHNALSEDEVRIIMAETNVQTRTEVFLDMLELHRPEDYDTFVEAVGETYPHVYLTLTGEADDRSDDEEGKFAIFWVCFCCRRQLRQRSTLPVYRITCIELILCVSKFDSCKYEYSAYNIGLKFV